MLPLLNRIKIWWTTADRNQRMVTVGGIGALFLLLVGTAFFATRPRYDVLFENLQEVEKGQIVEELTKAGIPNQFGRSGIIEVPSERAAEARMKLAMANKLPSGKGNWGKPDAASPSMFRSPEVEAQDLKIMLEGRIASTLETMEGVASATVLLSMPKSSVFAQDQRQATASVTLVESGQGMLSPANGRTIASLVCSAVDGMTPAGVFVASNNLGVLWDGKNTEAGGLTKTDLDSKTSRDFESKIQTALDDVFGPHSTRVMVRASVDMDKRLTKVHDVTPTRAPVQLTTEREGGVGAERNASGFAGTPSNASDGAKAPAQAPTTGKGTGSYEKEGVTKAYEVSSKDESVEGAVGNIKELALTVIANSDKIPDAAPVEQIVDGVLGGAVQRDEQGKILQNQAFSSRVVLAKFDGSAVAAAKAAADAAAGQQRTQQLLSLLPIGAILFVALLVAKQVGKISKAVLPAPMVADSALAEGEGPDALPLPEVAVEAHVPAALEEREYDELLALDPIRNRVDIPLESIKKMAEERPEMVATLIKSMMLGEKS